MVSDEPIRIRGLITDDPQEWASAKREQNRTLSSCCLCGNSAVRPQGRGAVSSVRPGGSSAQIPPD